MLQRQQIARLLHPPLVKQHLRKTQFGELRRAVAASVHCGLAGTQMTLGSGKFARPAIRLAQKFV